MSQDSEKQNSRSDIHIDGQIDVRMDGWMNMGLVQIWLYLIVGAGHVASLSLLSSFLILVLVSAGLEVAVGRGH